VFWAYFIVGAGLALALAMIATIVILAVRERNRVEP